MASTLVEVDTKRREMGGPDGKLAPWKRAAAALPLFDVLHARLAMPKPWLCTTGCMDHPVLVATRSNVAPRLDTLSYTGPFEVNLQRMTDEVAVKCICALWPSSNCGEVILIGPEVEALAALRQHVTTSKSVSEFRKPHGLDSISALQLSCENAFAWKREVLAGLRAHIKTKSMLDLPPSALSAISSSDEETDVLRGILSSQNASCPGSDLDLYLVRSVQKTTKVELYEALARACDAYVVAYVLNCTAKILDEHEITGLRALDELGISTVQKFADLRDALTGRPSRVERFVRLMLQLVGEDAEDEVRGAFSVPKAQVPLPVQLPDIQKPANPAAPQVRKEPQLQTGHSKERVLGLVEDLRGVPLAFIRSCFQMGVKDPEAILDRYTRPARPEEENARPGRTRRVPIRMANPRPIADAPAARNPPRNLEERIAGMRFGPQIEATIRANGIEPEHVALLVCKVFGYPHLGVRSRDVDDARSEVRKYLNGAKGAVRTVDALFRFMHECDLIKAGVKAGRGNLISLNPASGNPSGRAIFASIRGSFSD